MLPRVLRAAIAPGRVGVGVRPLCAGLSTAPVAFAAPSLILAQSGPDSPCDGESGEHADHCATDSEQRHGSVRPCHERKFFRTQFGDRVLECLVKGPELSGRRERAGTDRDIGRPLVVTLREVLLQRLVCVPPSVERRAGVGERSLRRMSASNVRILAEYLGQRRGVPRVVAFG